MRLHFNPLPFVSVARNEEILDLCDEVLLRSLNVSIERTNAS
jgi:hypothetical protein